ncbi:MAG TPA: hypothetical protein VF406_04545 [Thermodesulfobacteriota bacterium]
MLAVAMATEAPIPQTDPVWRYYALCPVCRDQYIEEVLFVADHLAREHGWTRPRLEQWVRDLRARRVA